MVNGFDQSIMLKAVLLFYNVLMKQCWCLVEVAFIGLLLGQRGLNLRA